MDVTVKVNGLAELEARLQELEALGGQKLVRRVLRKVAKPMKDAAVANAQAVRRSGALSASIGIFNRKPKGRQVAVVAVGSVARNRTAVYVHNAAHQRRRKGIFYGWMLDRGHRLKGGGTVGPRPWWTPAVSSTEGRSVSLFVDELRKAVERAERRKAKTANPDALVPE